MQRFIRVGLAAGVAVAAACAASVRPSYAPFRQAPVDTLDATPIEVIQEVSARLNAEDIQLQWSSPEEGYLETMWYNVISRESGVTDRGNPERFIKIRFWADPVGENRTQLTSEVALQRTTDPSVVNPRDREMYVPRGHAGQQILDRILAGVRERFGG